MVVCVWEKMMAWNRVMAVEVVKGGQILGVFWIRAKEFTDKLDEGWNKNRRACPQCLWPWEEMWPRDLTEGKFLRAWETGWSRDGSGRTQHDMENRQRNVQGRNNGTHGLEKICIYPPRFPCPKGIPKDKSNRLKRGGVSIIEVATCSV